MKFIQAESGENKWLTSGQRVASSTFVRKNFSAFPCNTSWHFNRGCLLLIKIYSQREVPHIASLKMCSALYFVNIPVEYKSYKDENSAATYFVSFIITYLRLYIYPYLLTSRSARVARFLFNCFHLVVVVVGSNPGLRLCCLHDQ